MFVRSENVFSCNGRFLVQHLTSLSDPLVGPLKDGYLLDAVTTLLISRSPLKLVTYLYTYFWIRNIKAVFQTQSTIRQRVMKVKGRPKKDEIKGVVHSIPCECGAMYIGETGRNLHAQVKEHERAVCRRDTMV